MGDHKRRSGAKSTGKSVGVRELKAHAAGILREVREARASYLVTHRGRAVGIILPIDSDAEASAGPEGVDPAAAWEAFVRAGRALKRRFAGAGGVRVLSNMRR